MTGAVWVCWGRGRLKGPGRPLDLGAGSAREGGRLFETEMVGVEAVESEIERTGETSIEGTETLMVGTVAISSMQIVGGSGALIVGMIGAEAVDTGSWGFDRSKAGTGLGSSRIEGRGVDKPSCLGSVSFGLQPLSKLTIGLPGRSLTTVGDGNFGLLSFIRMLVAALISSLRISMPSLVLGLSVIASSRPATEKSGGLGLDSFCR